MKAAEDLDEDEDESSNDDDDDEKDEIAFGKEDIKSLD